MARTSRSFVALVRRSVWILALSIAPTSAWAQGFIVASPHDLVPTGQPPVSALEIQAHRVRVAIRDPLAITEVEQVFRNPGDRRLEGDFWFPIPRNAAIERFSMEIDGKIERAELVDAARARSIYEDIVRRMRDPALLEYGDQGAFRVRVFPIEPRSTKRIKLSYSQVLRRDGGTAGHSTVEYSYPLDTEKLSAAAVDSTSVEVHVETRAPLKSVWSPSHTVDVRRTGTSEALIGFEKANARTAGAFRLFYTVEETQPVGLGVLTYRGAGDDDGYFLVLASPGSLDSGQQGFAKDVVFAVDTSGSMAGDKIEQLRRALRHGIATLDPSDRFEIVRFSTEAEPLFSRLVEASDANRAKASSFVDGLRAVGGTAIGEALTKALAPAVGREPSPAGHARPYVVVFITDGLPTVGETDPSKLVALAKSMAGERGVRIFSFGVGDDVDTRLLDGLGEATRGYSQYVGSRQDIEREVSSFCERIDRPALTGLSLRAEGDVRLSKLYPQELPDLFHGDQLVALGRFSGSGEARLILEGMEGTEKRIIQATVPFPSTGPPSDYGFIANLWATRRVGYLLDELRRNGDNEELRNEVASLARRHGIVTPYTSYLVLEDERRKDVPAPLATLPRTESGAGGRDQGLGSSFHQLEKERSGSEAVAGAKVMGALKRALSLAEPADEMSRAVDDVKASADKGETRQALVDSLSWSATRRQRHVAGKVFYQNGFRWIDAEVVDHANDPRIRVAFGSPEYFALARKSGDAGAWLAQGRALVVRIGGVTYEIVGE